MASWGRRFLKRVFAEFSSGGGLRRSSSEGLKVRGFSGTGNMAKAPTVKLSNGAEMPVIGLGTWKSPRGKTGDAVRAAIKAGYRMIDTANDYGNEDEVGDAIKDMIDQGVVKREELFIQCKLWNTNHRKDHVKPDLMATLKDLKLDYVDSFAVHWPQACPSTGEKPALGADGIDPKPRDQPTMFPLEADGMYACDYECHFMEAYHAIEDLVDEGLVRGAAISNFNARQVHEVLENCKKHPPVVLQNECHPYFQQKDIVDVCNNNGIVFQSYSPLGSGDRPWARKPGEVELLDDPRLQEIATAKGKSVAQVVLRWHMERGITAVPKSITPSRIATNIDVFDFTLSPEEVKLFDKLNQARRFLMWDPTSLHPDYPFRDDLPFGYKTAQPLKVAARASK
mmetsp:Transcript_1740/g.2677  ORF Transcript_1740/g.2677 Transcript_1740/m.2677 type:complete len:396 (-) Transcript_1740:128-1315(-)